MCGLIMLSPLFLLTLWYVWWHMLVLSRLLDCTDGLRGRFLVCNFPSITLVRNVPHVILVRNLPDVAHVVAT